MVHILLSIWQHKIGGRHYVSQNSLMRCEPILLLPFSLSSSTLFLRSLISVLISTMNSLSPSFYSSSLSICCFCWLCMFSTTFMKFKDASYIMFVTWTSGSGLFFRCSTFLSSISGLFYSNSAKEFFDRSDCSFLMPLELIELSIFLDLAPFSH